jgi:hypothetical protein
VRGIKEGEQLLLIEKKPVNPKVLLFMDHLIPRDQTIIKRVPVMQPPIESKSINSHLELKVKWIGSAQSFPLARFVGKERIKPLTTETDVPFKVFPPMNNVPPTFPIQPDCWFSTYHRYASFSQVSTT